MVVEPALDMATEEATEPWAVVPWAEPGTSLGTAAVRATLMPTATERRPGAPCWRNCKFVFCGEKGKGTQKGRTLRLGLLNPVVSYLLLNPFGIRSSFIHL